MKRRRTIAPMPAQLSLFGRRAPRASDEALLIRRLEAAVKGAPISGPRMSRAAIRRLMTPLPAITVPRR